ncbi:MAG: Crp/Fnr family transcriptional regulator [Chitinophagaceae bacterium]|nr:Crp/Fnr family transcriptional regulator [Chitinophagaceae bacterium]
MNYELILNNIARHIPLDKEETDYFVSRITFREFPKKALLLKEGQVCNLLSYVHSGALRAYFIDGSGKESTIMFAVPDWWVTDMYCFLNGRPAMMYIEAIENSCIFQIRKEDLDELYIKVPKFERYFRILMQNAYTREQLRVIENLSLPAKERYNNFLDKYPHIARVVTLKQIASYLGITPEFLSAIRKSK